MKNITEQEIEKLAEISSEIQEGTYTPQHKVTYKHGFIDGHKAALQNKVSDVSAEEVYQKIISTKPLAEYLTEKDIFVMVAEEYASIVNERKDNVAEPRNSVGVNDAIDFAEWIELEGYRIKGMDNSQRQVIYNKFKSESQPQQEVFEDWRQRLFNYMQENHNITLLESEMEEIKDSIIPRKFPITI